MDQAPWLLLWPCAALTGAVVALNLLCDRLRDVLDPLQQPRGGWVGGLAPRLARAAAPSAEAPTLLAVEGLTVEITTLRGPVHPVRDVSLSVAPGETLAIVGESGSGKTLTALALVGLLPSALKVTAGSARFAARDGRTCDLLALPESELRRLRGDQIALVFQDPGQSLNPVHRVGDQVIETIRAHRPVAHAAAATRAVELMQDVGLPDPALRAKAFPHELSGGQRQRATVAAAIANAPRLLIADEPTTALDVTIQAQILDLLAGLKDRGSRMGLIFITHNLAVVSEVADRVCVMYAGQIVESGPVGDVFATPLHPYTAALIASVPEAGTQLEAIPGVVPLPGGLPPGCSFAPRCARAEPACRSAAPALERVTSARASRCIKWRELP